MKLKLNPEPGQEKKSKKFFPILTRPETNHYEERKERKAEYYLNKAEQAKQESSRHYNESNQVLDRIVPGQPILVGHHSKKRRRRALERSWAKMDKSITAEKKAEYYKDRATTVKNSYVISSDDPEALNKLRIKYNNMLEKQEYMKRINKEFRRVKGDVDKMQGVTDTQKEIIKDTLTKCTWHKVPFPRYELTNNNQNMNRIKKRINAEEKKLVNKQVAKESPDTQKIYLSDLDLTIYKDYDLNRHQLLFSGKPPEETRKELKRNGFRWSPKNKAWQCYLNNSSPDRVYRILIFLYDFAELDTPEEELNAHNKLLDMLAGDTDLQNRVKQTIKMIK